MPYGKSNFKVIQVTPTLDTSAYADGDILFDTTEIPDAVIGLGGCSKLVSVAITNKQGDITPMTMYFQQAARGMGTANAAMDVVSANTVHAKQLGYIEAPTDSWKDMGSTCLFNAKTDEIILVSAKDVKVSVPDWATDMNNFFTLVFELDSLNNILSSDFNLLPLFGPIFALTNVDTLPLTSSILKPPKIEKYP